jgi:hypothetical protein
MPEEQTSAAAVAHDNDERSLFRQVLEKSLELVNSGDAGNYEIAMRMVLNFAESARFGPAQLPPVAIASVPAVIRRYLVLEISGGDEITAKSWYGLGELELEHLVEFLKVLLQDLPPRVRNNPPSVVLHKPTEVQA